MMSWFRISAFICFLAVALGAFGAHGLKEVLAANDSLATWKTASLYHFVHGLVLFILSLVGQWPQIVFLSFAFGVLLFSGSLYLLAITKIGVLGAITPLGGLLFLLGWGLLFYRGSRK